MFLLLKKSQISRNFGGSKFWKVNNTSYKKCYQFKSGYSKEFFNFNFNQNVSFFSLQKNSSELTLFKRETVPLLKLQKSTLFNRFNSIIPKSKKFPSSFKGKYEILRHGGHSHEHGHTISPQEKALAEKVTWAGLGINVSMTIFKGLTGYFGNSSAMLADAGHSAGDLISDVVTLITLKYARQPIDHNHPYGHGKFESVGALAVSALLFFTGIGIAHHSYEHFLDPTIPTQLALMGSAISIIAKEIIYQATIRIGKKQNSQLLIANAWHHRSDVVSSALAFFGILASQFGLTYGDPIAGIAVAFLIMKMGVESGWESLKELTDTIVNPKELDEMQKVILEVPGVKKCTSLRARKMGHYSHVDSTVEADQLISISAANQIGERVRQAILTHFPSVYEAQIRVIAQSQEKPKLLRSHTEIEEELHKIAKELEDIEDISHVSYHFLDQTLRVEINILINNTKTIKEAQEIASTFKKEVINRIPEISVADIHLDLDPESSKLLNHKH